MKQICYFLILLLTACTYGTATIRDPVTKMEATVTINSLWSDVVLDGFTITVNKDGTRTFTLDTFSDVKTTGLKDFNSMLNTTLPAVVGAAVTAAKPGL